LHLCDLVEKDNSDISDSKEEDTIDVNAILNELQQLSTHMLESSFQTFGLVLIHTEFMAPTDLVHAFLHGIVPYLIKTLSSLFTNTEKHS